MTSRAHFPVHPFMAMCLAIPGCGWKELDGIGAPLAGDAQALDSTTDAPEDAGAAGDALSEAGVSSLACTGDQPAVEEWTFDSGIEGWTLSIDTGVDGSTGDPSPGALRVDVAPYVDDAGGINGAWLVYEMPLGDLSARTVSAWVWLDSGTTPHLKVFVQTGTQYAWGDNGTILLTPRTWTCVSLPVSTPAYNQAHYDPTDVITVGFELLGAASFQLYVDTVRIY